LEKKIAVELKGYIDEDHTACLKCFKKLKKARLPLFSVEIENVKTICWFCKVEIA